jgi:hypothetical protein
MGLNSKAGKSQPVLLNEVLASTKSEVETSASGSDLRAPSFNFFAFWPAAIRFQTAEAKWSGRGETKNKLTTVVVLRALCFFGMMVP